MGEMQEKSDAQLLRDYAEGGHEAAFSEIVMRHTDFVYSAALRQVESSAAASDIAQSVFTDLARKAGTLVRSGDASPPQSLVGWLHRATRYAALNHLRDTRRRLTNERQAMEQLLTNSEPSADWAQIRPALDEALDHLDEEDREALLLRYFKNLDFRAVGLALGVSDDAAQKRASRAVEHLREFFSKRKVTIGATGLVAIISANAVQAAPVGLAATMSAAALAGTAVSTSTVIAATKTIAMTTLQKTLVTVTVAVLAGAGIYEARQAAQLREQNQTLQQQQAPLAEQIQQLQTERDDATNRFAALLDDNQKMRRNNAELLKLRNETGILQQQTNRLGKQVESLSSALSRTDKSQAPIGTTNYPRESWQFSGFDSAENALKSAMWAKIHGDVATLFTATTPEFGQELRNSYFKDKSDAEISAMLIEATSGKKSLQIMNRMVAADDQVVFQMRMDDDPPKSYTLMTLKNISGEWKVTNVEPRSDGSSAQ